MISSRSIPVVMFPLYVGNQPLISKPCLFLLFTLQTLFYSQGIYQSPWVSLQASFWDTRSNMRYPIKSLITSSSLSIESLPSIRRFNLSSILTLICSSVDALENMRFGLNAESPYCSFFAKSITLISSIKSSILFTISLSILLS